MRCNQDELTYHWQNYRHAKSRSSRDWLFDTYKYLIRTTRLRMLPEFKEWEDLEQEGSIALLTAIERFDPNRRVQFPTFAIRCIRTRYGKYLDKTNRRSRRQTSLYNEEGESMDLELLCGSTSSPEDVVVFNDACRFIREQVELLPSHLSEVLLKRYWEHKTHKQIAQELNRTASGMCQREKTSHSILRTKIPEDIFSR